MLQRRQQKNVVSIVFHIFSHCGSRTGDCPSRRLLQLRDWAQIIKQNNNFRKGRTTCRNRTGMKSSDPRRGWDQAGSESKGGRARQIVQHKGHTQCECLRTHTHTHIHRHAHMAGAYLHACGGGGEAELLTEASLARTWIWTNTKCQVQGVKLSLRLMRKGCGSWPGRAPPWPPAVSLWPHWPGLRNHFKNSL